MTMNRSAPWSALAVIFAMALVGFIGCNSQKTAPPRTGALPSPAAPAEAAGSQSKLFQHWPTPVGALIITGEMIGYLEPCGCTQGQLGGLGRRYDLIERLRAQGWPLVLIDLGSLADPPNARGGIEESKIKFNIALRALTAMNYDAIAFSAEDLRPSVDETLGQYLNLGDRPKIVAANVTPDPGYEKIIQPSVRASAGPVKIGITAVLDPKTLEELNDPGKALLTVSTPQSSLPKVLADLESDTHVQVLMVQGPPALAKELANDFPSFEIVVATSEGDTEPNDQPEMLNDGKTALVQVGKKGKFVEVVGLYQDPKQKFRYQRVNLNQKYKYAEPMKKLIDQEFQDELKTMDVVAKFPKHAHIGTPGATYIGAEHCKTCHPATFAKWATTKHAQGYEAIIRPERYRAHDAECVSCHTTGFEYISGFVSAEATPHLKGNQCENCHGPGSKHAAEPDNPEYRQPMHLTAEQADKNHLCLRCHDEDNDPHFEFTNRWSQIVHKGLDKYDDPKVHQGITLKKK
jgi:hypothetical protein